MKYFVVFALCIVATQAFSLGEHLSRNSSDSRIIAGKPAVNGQFPYMVHLAATAQGVHCGGSLIHASWVLTAAHCFYGVNPSPQIYAFMGDVERSKFTVKIAVKSYHNHPGWPGLEDFHKKVDMALLELVTPVTPTRYVRPIHISKNKADMFVGEIAYQAGFGRINDQHQVPDVLQWAQFKVLSNRDCGKTFGTMRDSTLCAEGYPDKKQASCNADSGSSLIIKRAGNNLLIGVSGFIRSGGCEQSFPSGFDRPDHQWAWIKEITKLDL